MGTCLCPKCMRSTQCPCVRAACPMAVGTRMPACCLALGAETFPHPAENCISPKQSPRRCPWPVQKMQRQNSEPVRSWGEN